MLIANGRRQWAQRARGKKKGKKVSGGFSPFASSLVPRVRSESLADSPHRPCDSRSRRSPPNLQASAAVPRRRIYFRQRTILPEFLISRSRATSIYHPSYPCRIRVLAARDRSRSDSPKFPYRIRPSVSPSYVFVVLVAWGRTYNAPHRAVPRSFLRPRGV